MEPAIGGGVLTTNIPVGTPLTHTLFSTF